MTQIIGLAGRKQSGKNTAVNFIYGINMVALGIVKGHFRITEKGELEVEDIFGDKDAEGIFDINRNTDAMRIFLADHLNPYVKVYSFADLLKENLCMQILGLTYEQCYGTDEQKNSLTHLKWEDMPGVVCDAYCDLFNDVNDAIQNPGTYPYIYSEFITHQPGPMTAREVMQYVGTNLFRKMYNNVWVDATIKRINDEGSALALITDCRFSNEVKGIQNAGGKVIRLTRNPHPEDSHPSETALDQANFNWTQFDEVIDNSSMSITEQNDAIYQTLQKWGMLPVELDVN